MDYEKKYKDALERARYYHCDGVKQEIIDALEYVFPELKESEDEKIRKAIIEFFELQDENTTYSFVSRNDILAWLEKQIYTKKELQDMGFAFTTNGDIVTPKEQEKDLKAYLEHEKEKWLEKQSEQKPAEWSEEDEMAIALIKTAVLDETRLNIEGKCIVRDWLKLLKDRVQSKQERSE